MKESFAPKQFEFSNHFFKEPIPLDYVELYQIGEVSVEPGGVMERHEQKCYEISCMLSGKGIFQTDDFDMELSEGDIHVITKDKMHQIFASKQSACRFAYLGFRLQREKMPEKIREIFDFYENPPLQPVHDYGEVRSLFCTLINEWYSEPPYKEIISELSIKQIIFLVRRLFFWERTTHFVPAKSKFVVEHLVYGVAQYIDNNITEELRIGDLARRFNYSESYLSHIFKEKTGISLQEYILQAKMRYAAEKLKNETCSITDIALDLNYSSSQAFGKMFKASMGCTPSAYREEHKRKADGA